MKINKNTKKNIDKKSSKKPQTFPKHLELKGFLSFFILHELKDCELSGDDLASRIGQRRDVKLTPGTIYPALKRLKKLKLVIYRREGRKKIYYLTALGTNELNAFYGVLSTFFSGITIKKK